MVIEKVEGLPEDLWPTEDDLIGIRRLWKSQGGQSGPYASFGICYKCSDMFYRYGRYYEKMICWHCFIETKRPKLKKRRKKRK